MYNRCFAAKLCVRYIKIRKIRCVFRGKDTPKKVYVKFQTASYTPSKVLKATS